MSPTHKHTYHTYQVVFLIGPTHFPRWKGKCMQSTIYFLGRHGICQLFNTSKIPKLFQFYPRKTRQWRHVCQRIHDNVCFTNLFWTNCQHLHSDSNYLVNTNYNNNLNLANYTERVIFCKNFSFRDGKGQ